MEQWKEYRLGEVVYILDNNRVPLSSKIRSNRKGFYPYYGAQGIIDYIDDYIFDGTYLLVAEDGENLKSHKQPIAQIAKGKYWVNNHAHILESNGICDIRYICYLLNTIDISGYVTGSAQPKLNQENLKAIRIKLPSLTTQIKIADLVSKFDDKIELNRKINSNLEEQAKALFKSWFIDFEPFKDGKFVDSELGKIPEGWKMVQFETFISECQDKVKVGTYPAYSVTNNGITPRIEKFKKQLSKATSKEKILRKDDLVFGMSRQILNWGIMQDEIGGVSSAYHVYRIVKERVDPTYLRYFISGNQSYFRDLIGTAAREGQSLDKGALMNKKLFIPSEDILQAFIQHITTLENAIRLFKRQCYRLSSLRDSLLPRLMSGEIEVRL